MKKLAFINQDDVVLTAEEAAGLGGLLLHTIVPRYLDSALRKLGVNPEGYKQDQKIVLPPPSYR